MSKSTGNTGFRKVDVDQYEEEKYEEEVLVDDGVTGPSDTEVQSLLAKGRNNEALQYVLSNPPIASKNQVVKERALQVVLKVLMVFKAADMDGALKDLDQPKLDTLMKYIYRGFEIPSEGSSGQLLTWHSKVFALTGLGSIVRVMTDRKRV